MCLHAGEVVLRGTLPAAADVPEHGGIAIKTWEPEEGYTIVAVQDVVVTEVR